MSKYLNAERRINVYWAGAMMDYFTKQMQFYKKDSLKWLKSAVLSFDCFLREEMKGAEVTELRAISNLVDQCTPQLVTDRKYGKEADTLQLERKDIYDFAEYALEYCLQCQKDFDTCNLRRLALKSGIPPLVQNGPCQYWRGKER